MQTSEKNEKKIIKLTAAEFDVVRLILEDHKPLKKLIKLLKESENEIEERMEAYAEFAPLLVNHSKSEKQSLYASMKKNKKMREEALEGEGKHGLADQLLEEIKRIEDELLPDDRENSEPAEATLQH